MFVRQALRARRVSFEVCLAEPVIDYDDPVTIEAMLEAQRIESDRSVKGYTDVDEALTALKKRYTDADEAITSTGR